MYKVSSRCISLGVDHEHFFFQSTVKLIDHFFFQSVELKILQIFLSMEPKSEANFLSMTKYDEMARSLF